MSKNKIEPTEPIEPIVLKLDFSSGLIVKKKFQASSKYV